jgi:hypothetical protein
MFDGADCTNETGNVHLPGELLAACVNAAIIMEVCHRDQTAHLRI